MERQDWMLIITLVLLVGLVIFLDVRQNNQARQLYYYTYKVEQDAEDLSVEAAELKEQVLLQNIKVSSLQNQVSEFWLSRLYPSDAEKVRIVLGKIPCRNIDVSVQNTYFGLLELKEFGYLRYEYDNGNVVFDTDAVVYCYQDKSAIPCDYDRICGIVEAGEPI